MKTKFKAWLIKEKRWADLNGLSIWFGNHPLKGEVYGITEQGKLNEYLLAHEDYILVQFTGLKDKNGKEIYEGDILEVELRAKEGYQYCGAVVFDNDMAMFRIELPENFPFVKDLYAHNKKSKVIGNVYENPELL